MGISGWELAVIILVLLAVVMWGPKKIPELARSLGEARAEFERASREPPKTEQTARKEPTSDDILIETARKLGINTEGKTKEQISKEIVEKVTASKEASA